MTTNISDRVSDAIEEVSLSDNQIADRTGVSNTTVWRWRTKKTKRFKERDLKDLSAALDIRYEWLQFGKGPKYKDDQLNQIKRAVNGQGESYKGLDQTLSNVQSKANSLKQDLQDLIDDIEKLKGRSDD